MGYNMIMDYIQRFWTKVDKRGPDDCWLWTAGQNNQGYGAFYAGKMFRAHRFAYKLLVGDIPKDKVIDHTCFNRLCQNPKHLRLLTPKENCQRANRRPVTHCKHGHPFTLENTKYHSKTGGRVCRACDRAYKREWEFKQRLQGAKP